MAPRFDKNWAPLLKAANLQGRAEKKEAQAVSDSDKVNVKTGKKSPRESLSIFVPLIKSFGWTFLGGSIIRKCFSMVPKITEISASSENCFFGNQTQVISNGH